MVKFFFEKGQMLEGFSTAFKNFFKTKKSPAITRRGFFLSFSQNFQKLNRFQHLFLLMNFSPNPRIHASMHPIISIRFQTHPVAIEVIF